MTNIAAPPVRLAGELDIHTAPDVLALGHGRRPGEPVTIDMSEVTFIDACALGAIVHLRNDVVADGGTLRLTAVPPRIARIFVVSGLAAML